MRKRKWGFSLLEVVIAVMVLSIGVLGVMSAMTYSVSQQTHAEILPQAAYYAQQIMQEIDIKNLHSTGIVPPALPLAASGVNSATQVAIDSAPFTTVFNTIKDTNGTGVLGDGDADINLTRFTRSIVMTRLSAVSTNYRYNLVRVTVTIFWQESSGVDVINQGNGRANNSGKSLTTKRYVLEAVLDND